MSDPKRIASVRSIQFEKRGLGLEMVMVLRMATPADVPPPDSEVVGVLQFKTGIVGISKGAASGRPPSPDTWPWNDLGKFKARRSTAPNTALNEVVIRTGGIHQTERLLQLMAAATEAYAPYSRLQLRLDGRVEPARRLFGFRRADPTTPATLGTWSAAFMASAPKHPESEIFKSPDLFGPDGEAVDASTAIMRRPKNQKR